MKAKTLSNASVEETERRVPDVRFAGNPNKWVLLCKAWSNDEGWMKSTKAMQTPAGCVVQVTTQQRNKEGCYSLAEALTFVPGCRIEPDGNGGASLVQW